MKKLTVSLLIYIAFISVSTAQVHKNDYQHRYEGRNDVFSPRHGIVCDPQDGFCATPYGVSPSETEKYLGYVVANIAIQRIKNGEDTKTFILSNGVICSSTHKSCVRDNGKYAGRWSRILYL